MSACAGDPVDRVVAGRRKIHDRDLSVAGYEFVFGLMDADVMDEPAVDRVVTSRELLTERGHELSRMLGDLRVFCPPDADILTSGKSIALPAGSVVEVSATHADGQLLESCRNLVDQGLTIAVDGLPVHELAAELLDLASLVKIDVSAHTREELAAIVDACRLHGVELLAANIETLPQFHHARRLAFDLFEGPAVQSVYSTFRVNARPASIAQLKLAADLLGEDLEFDELEAMLRPEPHLTLQIMQLASLGRIGETGRSISTVRDALVSAGTLRIQHWIALLSVFPDDPDNDDRMFESMLRAGACEYLAEAVQGRQGAKVGFAAGLLAAFGDLLKIDSSELSQLALSDELRDAAFGETSQLARIVRDVVEHQSGTRSARHLSGLSRTDLDGAFAAAFLWAIEATASLR